jgi:hypothetical protein
VHHSVPLLDMLAGLSGPIMIWWLVEQFGLWQKMQARLRSPKVRAQPS